MAVRSVVVDFRARIANFSAGVTKARNDLTGFQRGASRMKRAVNDNFRAMGREVNSLTGNMFSLRGALGSVLGAAGIGLLVRNTTRAADEIQKFSQVVGVSAEELQHFRYAAAQASGAAQEAADMGLQRFARRLGEARQGTGELVKDLEALGVRSANADGTLRGTVDVLFDYADAVARIENPNEQLRLAMKAFDSEGARMVTMLRKGSAGMRELFRESEVLGVVSNDNAAKAADVQARFDALAQSLRSSVTNAILDNADAIEQVTDNVIAAIPEVLELTNRLIALGDALPSDSWTARVQEEIRSWRYNLAALAGAMPGSEAFHRMMGVETPDETMARLRREQAAADRMQALNPYFQRGPFAADGLIGFNTPRPAGAPPQTGGGTGFGQQMRQLQSDIDRIWNEAAATAARKANDAIDARNTLLEEGKRLMESLRTPQEAHNAQMEWLNTLLTDGAIDFGFYGRAVRAAREELAAANDAIGPLTLTMEEAGVRGLRTMEDGLVDLMSGARSLKDAFGDMSRSIIADIVRMQIQASIMAPIANSLGLGGLYGGAGFKGGKTAGGGLLTGIGSFVGSLFGRAGGGRVSAGRLYRVNEMGGPVELFQPDANGTVTNRNAFAAASRGAANERGVTLAQTVIVNAQGAVSAGEVERRSRLAALEGAQLAITEIGARQARTARMRGGR